MATAVAAVLCGCQREKRSRPKPKPVQTLHDARETHLADVRQLTFAGENAEAYWSPDGTELVFQSTRGPYACDQIFRMRADGTGPHRLVSTKRGRATCAYFLPNPLRIIYGSTHHLGAGCPPKPDRAQGYVWPLYDYDLYVTDLGGSKVRRLLGGPSYDAEATVCSKDGSIVFTSTRDGDLELYRMDADGKNLKRLTHAPGYDGGAFFSPDCKQIVWRASRPLPGRQLEEYRRLLGQRLVRPGRLEIWVANADGSDPRQVTTLDSASFAPSFYPSGKRIIFSSNYPNVRSREFDLWAINVDGTELERITWTRGFDGFPLFSPDGKRLAFSSNRIQRRPGDTNVYVASWVSHPPRNLTPRAPDRFRADVAWLAHPDREGRGIGAAGLGAAARWIEQRFKSLGLRPAGEAGTYWQSFQVRVGVRESAPTRLVIDGSAAPANELRAAPFSASGALSGTVVAAGYGITAPGLGVDDYRGVEARGRIVIVRRFVPDTKAFGQQEQKRRFGDLRYKAWNARAHGATALLIVDLPTKSRRKKGSPAEAPLPRLSVDTRGDAGIPVLFLTRKVGAPLFTGTHAAEIRVALVHQTRPARNVIGRIPAADAARLPGAVLIGAHYDHLGHGGRGSFVQRVVHPGADDNASGVAAILEAARILAARRKELRRDVYVVAFAGEESGVIGSTIFTREPPRGLALKNLVAMLNLDMVGRLRHNRLALLGSGSAVEWDKLLPAVCARNHVECRTGGDGYGPSDHSPFYAAGIPVLQLFTGTHRDYHRPTDTVDRINAAGGARVAAVTADLTETLTNRAQRLTYRTSPKPAPLGDVRSYGAYLGTIPDYIGPPDGRPGMLLAGVRVGGPAHRGGLRRGDLLVQLGNHRIRTVRDLMYVLRAAKPGEKATAVVEREKGRVALRVIFGKRPRYRSHGRRGQPVLAARRAGRHAGKRPSTQPAVRPTAKKRAPTGSLAKKPPAGKRTKKKTPAGKAPVKKQARKKEPARKSSK